MDTGIKFATPYACIYGLHGESISQKRTNLALDLIHVSRYVFIRTASESEHDKFLERLNDFQVNLKFIYELSKENKRTSVSLTLMLESIKEN